MRRLSFFAVAALAVLTASAAEARCTKLAFSVNDYGKDGPTRDAKSGLDTYIAKWAKDRGIKQYTTGKKDVTCELYLDVGIFDEHTCKAEALVCWNGPGTSGASASDAAAPAVTPATKPAAKPAAKKTSAAPASIAAPVAPPAPAAPAAPAAKPK